MHTADTHSNMSLGVFRIQCVICPGLFYSSRSIWHIADAADGTFRLSSPNALRIVLDSPPHPHSNPYRSTSPSRNRCCCSFPKMHRPHRSPAPCAPLLSCINLHTGGGEKRRDPTPSLYICTPGPTHEGLSL